MINFENVEAKQKTYHNQVYLQLVKISACRWEFPSSKKAYWHFALPDQFRWFCFWHEMQNSEAVIITFDKKSALNFS